MHSPEAFNFQAVILVEKCIFLQFVVNNNHKMDKNAFFFYKNYCLDIEVHSLLCSRKTGLHARIAFCACISSSVKKSCK